LGRAEEVLIRLLEHYERSWRPRTTDPFRSLVRTILSQNTNYRNEATAFQRLESLVGVTPERLASTPREVIADAIRPAGMYSQRSLRLKEVAEAVIQRFDGDLSPVLTKPYEEARALLMDLPGVGPKTADVVLLFDARRPIIPVDRHIFRITKRLGLVPEKAGYEEVRLTLEATTPAGRHEDIHVLLIRFGREVCKALNPRCDSCFLNDLCSHPAKQTG